MVFFLKDFIFNNYVLELDYRIQYIFFKTKGFRNVSSKYIITILTSGTFSLITLARRSNYIIGLI